MSKPSQAIEVPQFRDGECRVRSLWDEAVVEALGWDAAELSRLRELLHNEPHLRSLGYEQYADELDGETANREKDGEEAGGVERQRMYSTTPSPEAGFQ